MKEFDYIVPFGSNCRVASGIKKSGCRFHSLPLDWGNFPIYSVNKLVQNKFEGFLDKELYDTYRFHGENVLLHKEYGFSLPHENTTRFVGKVYDKYLRRMKRMNEILNGDQRVLIVHMLMDCEPNDNGMKKNEEMGKHLFPIKTRSIDQIYQLEENLVRIYPKLDFEIGCVYFNGFSRPYNTSRINFHHFSKKGYGPTSLFDEHGVTDLMKGYKIKAI